MIETGHNSISVDHLIHPFSIRVAFNSPAPSNAPCKNHVSQDIAVFLQLRESFFKRFETNTSENEREKHEFDKLLFALIEPEDSGKCTANTSDEHLLFTRESRFLLQDAHYKHVNCSDETASHAESWHLELQLFN